MILSYFYLPRSKIMNCAKDADIKVFSIEEEIYFRNLEEEITFHQNCVIVSINVGWVEEREKYL